MKNFFFERLLLFPQCIGVTQLIWKGTTVKVNPA